MIITLDVWDTLLRRKCHPDQIKIFCTAEALSQTSIDLSKLGPAQILKIRQDVEFEIAQKKQLEGFDDEYEISEVYEILVGDKKDQFVKKEIEVEKHFSYVDPQIHKRLPKNHKQIILLSDFYISKENFERILYHHFDMAFWNDLIVSCDLGYNKRTGNLFAKINPKTISSDWTHIGDNLISDIAQAKKHGARVIHYLPKVEHSKRKMRERNFVKRLDGKLRDSNSWQFDIAVGLVGFSKWISSNLGEDAQISFLEREGVVLSQAYNLVESLKGIPTPNKQSQVLAVSRLSTFGAAFFADPISASDRFISQYRNAGIEEIEKSLNVNLDVSLKSKLQKLNSREILKELILELNKKGNFRKFMEDKFVVTHEYLNSQMSAELNVLVDVGWSGSIQANVAAILGSSKNISGRYLACRKNTHRDMRISSFLNSTNVHFHKIIRSVRPVELLFTPETGSVVGYEQNEGEIRVIRDFTPIKSEVFQKEMNTILSHIPYAFEYIQDNLLILEETGKILARGIHKFITEPGNELLSNYQYLIHDETFGINKKIEPRIANYGILDFGRDLITDRQSLIDIYWQVGWPESLAKQVLGFVPPAWMMRSVSKYLWRSV